MAERLFLSEYVEGTRTAHLFQRIKEQDYVVYCFCCGHEAETEPFVTEQSAEDWAEDWVTKTVELEELVEMAGPEGCGCSEH
jgi:hypothetical protein